VLQFKFLISLRLPISLIYGLIISTSVTYAANDLEGEIDVEKAEPSPSTLTRQRFKGSSSVAAQHQKDEEETKKAEKKLQDAFRKENKDHLNYFINYGMIGLGLAGSTMMLWNIEHSPEQARSSWTYTEADWINLQNQQSTFTNSGAFSTLQYIATALTVSSFGKSIYALMQMKDSLPSAKELKIKGKAFTWDACWVGMNGLVCGGFKGLPQLWKLTTTIFSQGDNEAYFRPLHGSTNFEELPHYKVSLGTFLRFFGGAELSLNHRLFKPVSKEFQEYMSNPPKAFSAKRLTLDLSDLRFSRQDFAYLVTLNNITELCLRNCGLTEEHTELLYFVAGTSIEKLDIRENPRLSVNELWEIIKWAVAPQNLRGIYGFGRLESIEFDARDDLINQYEYFTRLELPERRRIKASGELTRIDELNKFFNRRFYYFNKTPLSNYLPPELEKIAKQPQKRPHTEEEFRAFYKEKNFTQMLEVRFQKEQPVFTTDGEIINHIHSLSKRKKRNACFLVKPGLEDHPLLYMAKAFGLNSSFREKDYILTSDRIFRKTSYILEETDTDYLIKQANAARVMDKNISYVLEYKSNGNRMLYTSDVIFGHYNMKDIWFTPYAIYLPTQYRDNHDIRIYLSSRYRMYKIAVSNKLLDDYTQDISSFMTVDLSQNPVVLAEEFHHFSKNRFYLPAELEVQGLLTEVNLIKSLVRCNFLKSLKFDIIDKSWI